MLILAKKTWPFILVMAFVSMLPSQATAQFYVGLQGGITLPQGFYSESRMSDNGWMFSEGHQSLAGAGKGWSAGVELSYAMLFHPSLEVVLNAHFMQGGVNSDVEDYYEYVYSTRYKECSKYLMELPKFRNIPILLGVRYAYPVTKGIDLYGEALAGINLRSITDWTLAYATANWQVGDGQELAAYNNEDNHVYANANTFALRLGAGFLFKKKLTLGASFNMLGSSPLTWDRNTTVRYSVYGQIVENTTTQHVAYTDLRPTMVVVHLGFRLTPFKTRTVQDW